MGNIEVELLEKEGINEHVVLQKSTKARKINTIAKHYRGVVKGYKESLVALSVFDAEIMGVISIKGIGNFNITKQKGSDYHSIVKTSNLIDNSFTCGVEDIESISEELQKNKKTEKSTSTDKCPEIYFEVSNDIYNYFDEDLTDTENYVTALFNQVSTIYFQDLGVDLNLSEIFVWTSDAPYVSSSLSENLTEFRETRTSFNGDLAHLLTYKYSSASGVAYYADCNKNYTYGATSLSPTYEEYPNYSRQVKVIAHELGHNFGARHTHNCVWNDNDTQIDDYGNFYNDGSIVENSNGVENGCINEAAFNNGDYIPLLDVTPTIMSYYDSYNHQYQIDENGTYPLNEEELNLFLSNGFGEQPGAVILDGIINGDCYTYCDGSNDCKTINSVLENVLEGYVDVQKAGTQLVATNEINSGGSASYQGGEEVLMTDGFVAESNSVFAAIIEDCTSTTASNDDDTGTSIEIVEDSEIEKTELEAITGLDVLIYPNPTTGNVAVYLPEIGSGFIQIISTSGQVVFEKIITKEKYINFSIEQLPIGMYILNLRSENETIHKKIIKE